MSSCCFFSLAADPQMCKTVFLHQDFEMNGELKTGVICLLEEVLRDPDLLSQERKAATNLLRYTLKHPRAPAGKYVLQELGLNLHGSKTFG